MNSSLLVAAPLMIAAVVMAFRFVGCGIDDSPLPGYGDTDGNGNGDGDGDGTKPKTYQGEFTGQGALSAQASFPPNGPDPQPYPNAGTYSYPIPYWCTTIDLILLGAGGGGTYDAFGNEVGGGAGDWKTVTLQRGSDIPWAATTINVTVGAGGAGGTLGVPQGGPGGDTTASWDTAPGTTTETAPGGGAGASGSGPTGEGPSPGSQSVGNSIFSAGTAQSATGAAGNPPGGGGAGGDGLTQGGAGADGTAIIVASQS
jgi:hypothetical protein